MVQLSKWLVLTGAIWVLVVDGGGYNFGLYSEALKSSLGYNQYSVTMLGFFKNVGANVGLYCGCMYNGLGPRSVLLTGAILNFIGYFIIWLIVEHRIADPGIVVMCLLFYIAANAQAFAFSSTMVTCVKNFPQNRGTVIGVVTGFVGFSGAILAMIFQSLYGEKTRLYLLFNAWFASGIFILCTPLVKVLEVGVEEESRKTFRKFSLFCFTIAGYLFLVTLVKILINMSRIVNLVIAIVMVLGIVVTPLGIIWWNKNNRNNPLELQARVTVEVQQQQQEEYEMPPQDETQYPRNEVQPRKPERGDNFTVFQALVALDMWIMFIVSSCGIGSTLAALDNLGQMGTAWGYSTQQISNSVSFNNIWNFLGRVGAGWLSEKLIQKYGTPRPLVLAAVLLLTASGHVIVALKPPGALLVASSFEGFALGAQLTLIFTMTSELFGMENFAVLYSMATSFSTTVGTYLLSVLLVGNMFDSEARRQQEHLQPQDSGHKCYGAACYQRSFLIMVGVCMLGCLLSLVLAARTNHFYRFLKEQHKSQAK